MSVIHRVPIPAGALTIVEVGHAVEPAEVLATSRTPLGGMTIPIAARLRRSATDAEGLLSVGPGATLAAGDRIAADGRGREVLAASDCLFLSYDRDEGSASVALLGPPEPIIGHVRGEVSSVDASAIEIRVAGALVPGIGGSGAAVHGELRLAVRDPADELRAGAVDVEAAGRILVGGSRASAEALTRARAIGVAGIVLGGILDKELRDFEATQARHREIGAPAGEFAIVVLDGYGKVGLDPELFAWFGQHDGRLASLFGSAALLYVYDAGAPPTRRSLPRIGDRVIARRRPHAGAAGELVSVIDGLHATPAGVPARSGVVRFEDGRTAVIPIANLEAIDRVIGG